ncbi:hypothetical protein BBB56_21810 [Candidatus Pantoea deserta]|uniref:Uncharacterized protein n=1 Tax=Candidatus Pantoea deserta TaxID=1869313 RepID=A0A3N4P3S8_9GAMM|nr:hypothetical protein [Pantoea deserta]RPD94083.1 hypothetical protein BBB56_21810 [Pantoea deserta]
MAGDKAIESVKESKEWWKEQIREKLGENTASQLVNGLVSETGDTAFDLIAALATCATEGSYCSQAKSDIAKKDAAAAKVLDGIINGDAWEGIKSTAIKAANGNQKALENVAGVLSGASIPAKLLPSGSSTAKVIVKPVEPKGGAYGQILNLLNITSVDAQNQQQVKDALTQHAIDVLSREVAHTNDRSISPIFDRE